MRTTVNVHEGLLETAKQRAQERGERLGDVIESALQAYLLSADADPAPVTPLPTFDGGGVQRGVDLTSNESLHEAVNAEADHALRADLRR